MLLNAVITDCLLKPTFKNNNKYFIPYAENIMGSNLIKKTETHGNSLLRSLWKETNAELRGVDRSCYAQAQCNGCY